MELLQSKPKVFITGASGLLGRQIMEEASNYDFDPVGIAFKRVQDNLLKCDLTKPGEVEKLIEEIKPDFIVHTAAERRPDKFDTNFEAAKLLNIETPRRLALIAKTTNAKLIHISTDYVFDGSSPPYKENDAKYPVNPYGVTKHEGEEAVIEANPDACILRIPLLFGPVEELEESAVTCLLRTLLKEKEDTVSHYEERYPTYTPDLARIICGLLKALQKDPSMRGVFQWSGKEKLTKYDMMKVMAKVFFLPHSHIKPYTQFYPGSRRPFDVLMDTSRLEKLGISYHRKFEDSIKECLQPWITKCGKIVPS